jgi:hypothetical protein
MEEWIKFLDDMKSWGDEEGRKKKERKEKRRGYLYPKGQGRRFSPGTTLSRLHWGRRRGPPPHFATSPLQLFAQ